MREVWGAVEWALIAELVVITATLLTCGRMSDLIWRQTAILVP